jgi:hypothetical protein
MPTQLTTLEAVKAWLNLPDTNINADDLLTGLITAASGWIEDYLERTIALMSYSQYFNGPGGYALLLPEYPVVAVSAVSIDGIVIPVAPPPGPNQSSIIGYLFDDSAVYLRGYRFTRGVQNVAISWQAGYATVPVAVAQAAIELVSLRYKERDRIGEQSKIIQGMQVNFSLKDMPADVARELMIYKKVVPV